MDSPTTSPIIPHSAIGAAARLDERIAEHTRHETEAAAACYGTLLVLLREARAALPAEHCGFAGSLAGRIDDVLFRRAPEPATDDDLTWTRLPSGEFAWLRP